VLSGEAVSKNEGSASVIVHGAASSTDSGHRYGNEPARGDGLATALDTLRQRFSSLAPIGTTFAGFNGESFDAKLWGVARLRHNDLFSKEMSLDHPADKFGDTGAAIGAILLTLAAKSLATATRSGPALIWAASDREPRACALISATR
jgi:3-oxoacyl-[acyl-carrier-protein] synthase-1